MKRLGTFLAALLLLALGATSPVAAQGVQPAPVFGSWQMINRLASAVSVTSSSAATALPTGGTAARLCNTGSTDAYVLMGTSSGVAVTSTTGSYLKNGTCASYTIRPQTGTVYTYFAAITASSTTSIYVEVGVGSAPQ